MYRQLLVEGYTQVELAELAGRSVSHICERLKLLEWPVELVARVDSGEITIAAAKRSLTVPAPVHVGPRGRAPSRDPDASAHPDTRVVNSFTLEELTRFLTAIVDDDWVQGATRSQARRLLRAVSQALNVELRKATR